MSDQQTLDGMGRARLYPEREQCALCGRAVLNNGRSSRQICKRCEVIMPLEDIYSQHL